MMQSIDELQAEVRRAASARVRVVQREGGGYTALVDGEPRWRTNSAGEGVWQWMRSGVVEQSADGSRCAVMEWRQIIGTCQASGRRDLRAVAVDALAAEMEEQALDVAPLPAGACLVCLGVTEHEYGCVAWNDPTSAATDPANFPPVRDDV